MTDDAPDSTRRTAEPDTAAGELAAGGASGGADEWAALRAEADAKAREAAQAQDRYLRTLAEFDNYRKRVAREREEWRRQAQTELVREVLPVVDNFDRALAADPRAPGDSAFRDGIELIHRDFLKALERIGVRPFSAAGERFDPARHEAVGRVERADLPDQTVVEETLRGYLFHDRVLRPAQVIVSVEGVRL
jgi:molecular chaperone GrpE